MTLSSMMARSAAKRRQRGATAIEYALLASLIAVVAIGAITATGDGLIDLYQHVADKVVAALA